MRHLSLTDPPLEGDDVAEVQRKIGMKGDDVDGVYGAETAAKVEEWKWKMGYPEERINDVLGLRGLAWMFGQAEWPADFKKRAEKRKGKTYAGSNGVVRPLPGKPKRWSEFRVPDPEGAPSKTGQRFHAGLDWMAKGNAPVRAPVAGKLVEVEHSDDVTGQVFGGELKIEARDGRVWVFRHVTPKRGLRTGLRVRAGDVVAQVTPWRDGPPHAHIEVWKTFSGGYRYENMEDPLKHIK